MNGDGLAVFVKNLDELLGATNPDLLVHIDEGYRVEVLSTWIGQSGWTLGWRESLSSKREAGESLRAFFSCSKRWARLTPDGC